MSSVEKALKIVIRLSDAPHKMRLTEIAEYLQMSKSATYQILCDLENFQFIFRDSRTKLYHLGPVLLRLGYVYDQIKGLKEICLPIMQEIATKTGFTCYVSIREGIHSFLAYKVDSPKYKDSFYRDIMGELQSFNCGATGKLMAAYLTKEEFEVLLSEGLKKRTSKSITNKDELLKEYAKIREQGYSTAIQEFNEDTWGIGVPIFDQYSEVVATLGIMGPIEDYSEALVEKSFFTLKNQARVISGQLRFK